MGSPRSSPEPDRLVSSDSDSSLGFVGIDLSAMLRQGRANSQSGLSGIARLMMRC